MIRAPTDFPNRCLFRVTLRFDSLAMPAPILPDAAIICVNAGSHVRADCRDELLQRSFDVVVARTLDKINPRLDFVEDFNGFGHRDSSQRLAVGPACESHGKFGEVMTPAELGDAFDLRSRGERSRR